MKRKYLSMAVGCALLAPAAFVQAEEQQPAGARAIQAMASAASMRCWAPRVR